MYRIFKSLFISRDAGFAGLPSAMLEGAIERAVDLTDRRLRALSGYRRHLRTPVARARRHVIELVGQLPDATEISPRQYGNDPRLRAAFASPNHVDEVLGRFQTVRDYLGYRAGAPPDEIFGLLMMTQRHRRVLGMELDDTLLKRDVLQTAVSFADHRYIAPGDSERGTRDELEQRAFDFLLKQAAERIGAERLRRGDLIRTRQQLRRKVEVLQSNPSGRGARSADAAERGDNMDKLEAEIERVNVMLGRPGGARLSLEDSLHVVVDTLNRAEEILKLQSLRMNIDHRGIEVDAKTCRSKPLEIDQVVSSNGLRYVVLLGRIPRSQLPEPKDVVKRGEAYLGLVPGRR